MPVSGAPTLGENPYVSAAASAGSTAASLANSLQEAADQHTRLVAQQQQQQRARQVQEMNDYVRYLGQGAVPMDTNTDPNRPTLMQDPQQAYGGRDPSRIVNFPTIGRSVYVPTDEEREQQKLNDSNSATVSPDQAKRYNAAGYKVQPGQRLTTSLMGEYERGTQDFEKRNAPKQGNHEINLKDFADESGNPVPVMIDRDSGKVTKLDLGGTGLQAALGQASQGAQSSAAAANGEVPGVASGSLPMLDYLNQQNGVTPPPASNTVPGVSKPGLKFTPKADAAKREPMRVESTDKAGNVHVHLLDPDTHQEIWSQTYKGEGKPDDADRRAVDRQQDRKDAQQQREQDRQDKLQEAAKTRHDKLQSQEQDQWNLKSAYYDLADPSKHKDNEFAPEPKYNASTGEISEGQDVRMTPQRRKVYQALGDQAEQKARAFHQQSADIRQKFGWGEFAKQGQPAGQQGQPAAQVQQSARSLRPAKAGMPIPRETAKQYVQKYGSPEKARKIATADGWSF